MKKADTPSRPSKKGSWTATGSCLLYTTNARKMQVNYGQRAFVREDIKTQTAEKPEIPKRQRSLKNPKEKLIWQRLTPARLRALTA